MGLDDDIAFFERVPLFAALDRQALQILAIGAETKQMQSGAVLFYAGELADGGYIVRLEDGSRWTQTDGKMIVASPRVGDKVVIKKGSLTSYFLSVNKQPSVKVKRIA